MYSLLLVDDERLELETLRDYIAWDELGFDRVYTARGGRDGYDKALRLKPDVMITDIHMPVMNGIELAKQLYADGCTTKVIFLTGYDEFEYAKAALQVEAVDYRYGRRQSVSGSFCIRRNFLKCPSEYMGKSFCAG